MNSCLYECHMTHARFAPRAHRFAYRIFLFALDLDELAEVHRKLHLFSLDAPNLYSFREKDYLPFAEALVAGTASQSCNQPRTLKQRVIAYAQDRGTDLTDGRVILVTLPRIAGTLFNPVSFYFCYDRTGAAVAVLAEVTNTFRERKVYFLPGHGPESSRRFRLRVPKYFYVSPFSDVDVEFDFDVGPLGAGLAVKIDDYTDNARTFSSTLAGGERPLTTYRIAWYGIKYPLLTLRIVAAIHWHALLLWLKGAPWFAKAARVADQRDVYRAHHSLATSTLPAALGSEAKSPTLVVTSFSALKLP